MIVWNNRVACPNNLILLWTCLSAGMRTLTIAGFAIASLLFAADEPRQKVQVTHTEHMDFPSGGTLRLKQSSGVLTVEGWNQPEVEMTTTKSTKTEYAPGEREKAMRELDKVRVAATRQGSELVITTDFPRGRVFPPYPREQAPGVDLEYRIKVPIDTRLIAAHRAGDVNVETLTGDIDVTVLDGQITLHLPDEDIYGIRAKTDLGEVDSDFRGPQTRRWWMLGHQISNSDIKATHQLNLGVRFGNIVILKTRIPSEPAPLTPAPRPDAQ